MYADTDSQGTPNVPPEGLLKTRINDSCAGHWQIQEANEDYLIMVVQLIHKKMLF
jgi:hypothetical protein